jgi:hypothetical protein
MDNLIAIASGTVAYLLVALYLRLLLANVFSRLNALFFTFMTVALLGVALYGATANLMLALAAFLLVAGLAYLRRRRNRPAYVVEPIVESPLLIAELTRLEQHAREHGTLAGFQRHSLKEDESEEEITPLKLRNRKR